MIDSAINAIQSAIFWLLLKIDAIVYTLIDWIYQIILMLANGNILSNTELIDELINRLYTIIGVIILFLVAYSLLRSMVNPDEALKGKESPVKIVQNVIISVVLIAVIPYIFEFAMNFQTSLLQQNTIGKLILGEGDNGVSSSETVDDGGFNIAINVFSAFFQPNNKMGYCTTNASINQNYPDCKKLDKKIGDYNDYDTWWETEIITNHNLFAISQSSELVADESISYTFIISTIAGVFVVFVLISYCIDIAIRLVKLSVFQLIAPLPILARIVPKEDTKKIFSNWLKATISTYVEVFIRLGILFFAVFIIDVVVNNFNTIFNVAGENWGNVYPFLLLLAQALVILGIILFVKQLPQIIKDITGLDGGKYGKSLIRGVGMMASTLGGGTTAAIRSAVNDKDKPISQRIGRGIKAGLSANARGLWHGSKVEKLGDIPKAAGTASANALAARGRKDAAGGFTKYMGQKLSATKDKARNWLSSEDSSRIQEFASKLDSDVSQAQGVYKKSQDYIDAKALYTKLKNEYDSYEQAWNKILAEAQNDERTKDPTKEGYISADELATQRFVQNYGKSFAAIKTEKEAAKANVDKIKRDESSKKASLVASATRDFAFQLQRFSDLNFNMKSAIEAKAKDSEEAEILFQAYDKYSKFEGEELSEKLMADLKSDNKDTIEEALKYIDALDMAKNYALDLQSTAAFKENAYKAKMKDASGDKKK